MKLYPWQEPQIYDQKIPRSDWTLEWILGACIAAIALLALLSAL